MKKLYTIASALIFAFSSAQTGIAVPSMSACDLQVQNFMNTYNIPSATFAVTKDGKLVYSRAFGYADIGQTSATQPYNMFRLASISKPLTSVGIMKLVENGSIALSDHVFGPGGILENHSYLSNSTIADERVYDITLQMLLEHSAGWNRDIDCTPNPTTPYPYDFSHCDPIAFPLHVTQTLGVSNPVHEEDLIAFLLGKNLNFDPGSQYSYSNIGYLLLSEIIEEVSGMEYEAWMQQEIFRPLGIYDMHIGKNLLADKFEREGEYIGNGYTNLSLYNTGQYVPWEYGGFSVEAMDGHGGWMGSARDLLRLMVAVDGFSTKPDILQPATIANMVTPATTSSFYAKGWSVNTLNNWWHTGALDGTASILVRTSGGYTWAVLLNKRVINSNANAFWNALDSLGWNCISSSLSYPTHDLFDSPLQPATGLNGAADTPTSATLQWTNGDGTSRVVAIKQTTAGEPQPFSSYPIDGTDYTATGNYATAPVLPDGTRIIYSGTENSVTISNLPPETWFAVRVYECRKTSVNGNNALYLLGEAPQMEFSNIPLGVSDFSDSDLFISPNPAGKTAILTNAKNRKLRSAHLKDLNGKTIREIKLSDASETSISVEDLASGVYLMEITSENTSVTKRLIKK